MRLSSSLRCGYNVNLIYYHSSVVQMCQVEHTYAMQCSVVAIRLGKGLENITPYLW